MTAIVVRDLAKRFGRFTVVQGVSFEVTPGQVTALLGPNGAGKTTTIEILEGFASPSAGIVQHHVDLTGLEVGSPSLEDAYLALTAEGALIHG